MTTRDELYKLADECLQQAKEELEGSGASYKQIALRCLELFGNAAGDFDFGVEGLEGNLEEPVE